jgi:hypothetical protein
MGLQILLTRTDQQLQRTVANRLANVYPLSCHPVDGGLLVDLFLSSGYRGRKQFFEEIVDRLEQDQIQPVLCR